MFNRAKVRLLEDRCQAYEAEIKGYRELIGSFTNLADLYNRPSAYVYGDAVALFRAYVQDLQMEADERHEMYRLKERLKKIEVESQKAASA